MADLSSRGSMRENSDLWLLFDSKKYSLIEKRSPREILL